MSGLTGDWGKLNSVLNPSKLRASMKQCASRVGNYGASEVKKGIVSGAPGGETFTPLSAITIARKGSSKPLINHGDLVGSVTYQTFNNENSVFIGVKKGVKRKNNQDSEMVQIAAVHEFGCTIAVTPKMRAYLHRIGIHLKSTTQYIHIPARPFLRPVLTSQKFHDEIRNIYTQALMEAFEL